jgi:hypothetical protein
MAGPEYNTQMQQQYKNTNTMASAAVVALLGSKSKKYINIGTDNIAPPAPTNPRTAPIKTPAAIAPINSNFSPHIIR